MSSLSKHQLAKLSAALALPLPKTSDQFVTLKLADSTKMKVRKGLLAMASTVLSEALQLDPECTELKVDGTADAWQRTMALVLCTRDPKLQPNEVEVLLPIAHRYNMQIVLELLESRVRSYTFSIDARHPLYVMKWLSLARKYQVSWLGTLCTNFILSQMGEAIALVATFHKTDHNVHVFLKQFSPDNAASVDAPPDSVVMLTTAFGALRSRMGL